LPSVDKENSFSNETTSAYVFFYAFFLTILVCANLTVLLKIIEQIQTDIFLMDWEKPTNVSSQDIISKTIAWRSIMVANALNDL
jgi:hypothetical protein